MITVKEADHARPNAGVALPAGRVGPEGCASAAYGRDAAPAQPVATVSRRSVTWLALTRALPSQTRPTKRSGRPWAVPATRVPGDR
jgi:hypothetical protein